MGRYTGPSCRVCRREGMKLFLKGTRCQMAKCPIETGRPVPGMHGQRRGRKVSDYGAQLHEKQRLRRQFGMQEHQFELFFDRAAAKRGVTGEQLLQLLETRLDNVVYRMGFAASRRAARQMVVHAHVMINNRTASIPSMTVKAGSVIAVRERARSREMGTRNMEMTQSREVPSWLLVDAKKMSGELLRIPTRVEIAPIVDEQLIVEFYSK